jgi:hypothetical protein
MNMLQAFLLEYMLFPMFGVVVALGMADDFIREHWVACLILCVCLLIPVVV